MSKDLVKKLLEMKEAGILDDAGETKDKVQSLLMLMSSSQDTFMKKVKRYLRQSRGADKGKRRGGGGGGGGGDVLGMMEQFQSAQVQNVYIGAEKVYAGVEAGPDLAKLTGVTGYTLASWGSNGTADGKVIAYLLNTESAMASVAKQLSVAERTEAFYAMLEHNQGRKSWGNMGNLGAILPLSLLTGSTGLGTVLGAAGLTLPAVRF